MKTGEAEVDDVVIPPEDEPEDVVSDEPQDPPEDEPGDEPSDPPEGEEETVVSIGSEEPPTSEVSESDSTVLADLRRRYRETSRELQKLKAQGAGQQPAPVAPTLRKKPTLEEHDFDAEKYDSDLDKWYAEKNAADELARNLKAKRDAEVEAQQKATREVQERYEQSKATLKVKDFKEAEDEVIAHTDPWQQGILAKVKNSGPMVYALGKNLKKLQELASIKDPVEFAFAVADLRKEINVTTRKSGTKPAPEKTVGGGSGGSTSKATLERLQAEAEKTGDRSKIAAYLRQQRTAARK